MKRFLKYSSRGDTDMVVVLVILIGAFLLIGGQFFFQKPKPTNRSGGNPGGGGNSVVPLPAWRIEIVANTGACDNTKHEYNVDIAFHGPSSGFYKVEVLDGTSYVPVYINNSIYNSFTPNEQHVQVNTMNLANSDGFNSKQWKVILYEGGTLSGNDLTGATQQVKKDMDATDCQ